MFAGFRYFLWLRQRQRDAITNDNRTWIIIGALFGAVFGSRLIGGLENPAAMRASGNMLLYFYLNKTIVGGLLGGLAGVELTKLLIGEKQSSGDLFVYPLLLAMIIGRTGCFSMGIYEETYGLPTTLPWGMNLGDGIYRHPASLYEIVFLVLLWIALAQVRQRIALRSGSLFKLFMIAYLVFRFLLDFIKPHYFQTPFLSTIQLTCLAGCAYYAINIATFKLTSYARS